jgi:uncharacterized membrane protein
MNFNKSSINTEIEVLNNHNYNVIKNKYDNNNRTIIKIIGLLNILSIIVIMLLLYT